MSSTLDRIRLLNSLRPLKGAARDIVPPTERRHRAEEELPTGAIVENSQGVCYVTTNAYALSVPRGVYALGAVLGHAPASLSQLYPEFNLHQIRGYEKAVFLDTETTGLGAGASIYAFMVGVGMFETLTGDEPDIAFHNNTSEVENGVASVGIPNQNLTHFVVRQYFMRNPAEELALLDELAALFQNKHLLVTFNGRSFDMPLLRSRLRYNRPFLTDDVLNAPLYAADSPHLDLLLPARRLWRRRLQSCRLANLENVILGHQRDNDDVPGYLIPQMYTEYLQTGDAREMTRVFYHNLEDIVSMVSLATHLSTAFGRKSQALNDTELHGQDWLSLGIAYERMNQPELAEPAYKHALDVCNGAADKGEAFRRLGSLQKRQGRWQDAASTWELWLTSVPGIDPTPYVELAKYSEWQVNEFDQAEMWTAWALHNLQNDDSAYAWERTIAELEHRLERIRRKK